MAERKYPYSKNRNRSTEYLEDLKKIRDKEGLPTPRIDDELECRRIEKSDEGRWPCSDDDCDS